MKVLVVGSGGREHALVLALVRDPNVSEVHSSPGNPGIAQVAKVHQVDPIDGQGLVDLASKLQIDLVVIGPEAPLVAGVSDQLRAAGFLVFGPSKSAAQLEGSKAFAKEIMAAANIPTARSFVCTDAQSAERALDEFGPPYVVKDDGLASGKGVVVTSDRDEAMAHALSCARVVIEEYLDGPEVSLFGITDGTRIVPLQPAQDFKRAFDNDKGPNTGGMGAYTPLDWAPDELVAEVAESVLQPTIDEMARRGTPFSGLLYAGLALTSKGVKVVEFNARFGDPETQPLLAMLDSPISELLMGAASGNLTATPKFKSGAAVAVVMSSHGYPQAPRTGDVITGIERANQVPGVDVIHAGTSINAAGELVTSGGRVLAVTAQGADLTSARERAYEAVAHISFADAHYRSDIGLSAEQGTIKL